MKDLKARVVNISRVFSGTLAIAGLTVLVSNALMNPLLSVKLPSLNFNRGLEYAKASGYDRQAQDDSSGKISVLDFDKFSWVATPGSNLSFAGNQILANKYSCIAGNYNELDATCSLLFSPYRNNVLPNENSLLKSFTIGSEIAQDSEVVVQYVDYQQQFKGYIGSLTSYVAYNEFNVPSDFEPTDYIRLIFWNKSTAVIPASTDTVQNNTNEPVTYCSVSVGESFKAGYNSSLTIANPRPDALYGWQLEMKTDPAQVVLSVDNTVWSQVQDTITLTPKSDDMIFAQQSIIVPLDIAGGTTSGLHDFKINGVRCNETVSPQDIPSRALQCAIEYTVDNDWRSGFGGSINITNRGTKPVHSWKLAYSYSGNQKLTSITNAELTQTNAEIKLKNIPLNQTIEPGKSVTIDFKADYSGANEKPTQFMLNNSYCGETGTKKYGTTISNFAVNYLSINNLQKAKIKFDSSQYAIADTNLGVLYYDINRDGKLQTAIDLEWTCREQFPGIIPNYHDDGTIDFARNTSCYKGKIPEKWQDADVALPKGEWILSYDGGKTVIPFVIPDETSTK